MSEYLILIAVGAIPCVLGFIIARRCARPLLTLAILFVALSIAIFVSSVPYAAFSITIITGICAGIGYMIGSITPPAQIDE